MRSLSVSLILLATPVAAQTYDPVQVEPQIAGSPQTMTPLSLGDDNARKVDLGFDFTYWGQTFSSAWVGSNGTVSFSTSADLCCSGHPMEEAPRNTIYGFWTDLISHTGNPYYRRGEGSILFGWYGTFEYATNNQYTFEIALGSDSSVQFNYGSMPNLYYHYAAAGMTGPTSDDNITLFYGRDPRNMQYQSGRLVWQTPEPVITVDCAVTPMDPSCPPQMVAPVQTVTTSTISTIQEAYAADVQADAAEVAAVAPEAVQEIAATGAVQQTESVTEQVAAQTDPERLSPDQVVALAAPADAFSMAFAGFAPMQSASASSASSTGIEAVSSSSSPSSAANTLEALNMASMPAPTMSATQDAQSASGMGAGQQEAMEAMASAPAFTAYTQISLQDRPDFYAPRDIYKNKRLRDNNFEMYRMTRSSSDAWQEMVDEQYGR